MLEYFGLVALASAVVLLFFRYFALKDEVAALEARMDGPKGADLQALQEGVARILEDLKQGADSACTEVTAKIEELRSCESTRAFGQETSPAPGARAKRAGRILANPGSGEVGKAKGSTSVPIDLILQLSEQGLSDLEIARRARVGIAEVRLTLDYRHRPRSIERGPGDDSKHMGKEVGVA